MTLGKDALFVSCGIVLAALLARAGAVYATCNTACILHYEFETSDYFYYQSAVAKETNQEGSANTKVPGTETIPNKRWDEASCTRQCAPTADAYGQAKQASCTGGKETKVETLK